MSNPQNERRINLAGSRALAVTLAAQIRDMKVAELERQAKAAHDACNETVRAVADETDPTSPIRGDWTWGVSRETPEAPLVLVVTTPAPPAPVLLPPLDTPKA